MLGAVLTILSQIGFFVSFFAAIQDLSPPSDPIPLRVGVFLLLSIFILVGASAVLRTRVLFWQIPLLAFALASICVGIRILIGSAFDDWHLLFGSSGMFGALCLVAAVATGVLVRYLQTRFIPERDA
jgi:hypothetical protein